MCVGICEVDCPGDSLPADKLANLKYKFKFIYTYTTFVSIVCMQGIERYKLSSILAIICKKY